MKKLLMTLLLLLAFTLGCANEGEQISIRIMKPVTNIAINESYKFVVFDNYNNELNNTDLLWECSDYNICKIEKDGTITPKTSGLVTIKATYKKDLSVSSETQLFFSYNTVKESTYEKKDLDSDIESSGLWDTVAKYGNKYGKVIVKSLLGKASSLDFYKTIIDVLITKDTYMFTMTYPLVDIKNGIVYTISEWTNFDVAVNLDSFSTSQLSKEIYYSLDSRGGSGKTISEFVNTIKAEIMDDIPLNNLYQFSYMNRSYQYRVVVRADFQTVLVQDMYSTGAAKGILDTLWNIDEIGNWTFDYIFNNFGKEVLTNEVFNIKNIKLCIEYRERN